MKQLKKLLITSILFSIIACEYAPVNRKDLQESQDKINKRTEEQAQKTQTEVKTESESAKPIFVSSEVFDSELNILKSSDSFEVDLISGIKIKLTYKENSDKSGFSYVQDSESKTFYGLSYACKARSQIIDKKNSMINLLSKYKRPFIIYTEKDKEYLEYNTAFALNEKFIALIQNRITALDAFVSSSFATGTYGACN